MRLIDADEVKRFYEEDFPTVDNGVHWSRNDIIMNLSNIPTVKAIPIEWIKKWCNKEHNRKSLEERLLKRYGVLTLLEDWKKGNDLL